MEFIGLYIILWLGLGMLAWATAIRFIKRDLPEKVDWIMFVPCAISGPFGLCMVVYTIWKS